MTKKSAAAGAASFYQLTSQIITLSDCPRSNTGEDDARQLAELTRGLPIHIDLIDVNDPTGGYRPPSPEELSTFMDALRLHVSAPVGRHYSGGKDRRERHGLGEFVDRERTHRTRKGPARFVSPSDLRPLSSVLRPLTSVLRPLTSALCPPPSVLRPLSSVLRPLSSALCPPPSVLRPLSSVLRPLTSAL